MDGPIGRFLGQKTCSDSRNSPIKRPATDGEEVSPMDGHPSSTSPVSASRRSCSKATPALRAFDLDRGRIVGFGLKIRRAVVVNGTAPSLGAEMVAYEPFRPTRQKRKLIANL